MMILFSLKANGPLFDLRPHIHMPKRERKARRAQKMNSSDGMGKETINVISSYEINGYTLVYGRHGHFGAH